VGLQQSHQTAFDSKGNETHEPQKALLPFGEKIDTL
jgi:LDH2 family malate/lactate/ureidoglycolate dehydrogenase